MFHGKTHYKWPFSIAMLVYQRVIFHNIPLVCHEYPTTFVVKPRKLTKTTHHLTGLGHHRPPANLAVFLVDPSHGPRREPPRNVFSNIAWLILAESQVPSGKNSHRYGKSPLLVGKSTINGHFQ